MRYLQIDSLFPTIFQILPDQWIQELLDHVRKQPEKDTNDDHLASYNNDITSNSSFLFRDDQDKHSLGTLWKESDILLLHNNGESHLDDDGELVDIIKRGSNVANNMFNICVFSQQRPV